MKSTPNLNEMRWAFTRAELLVIVAVVTLLALVVLPALANTRPRSARVICANNLRQIGGALQLWANDHGGEPPHHVPVSQGGTKQHPLAANTWLHFSWISNELVTPKVLFCPSDTGIPASDFTGNPTGGYVHPNFANRATSYFLTFTYSGDDHRIQAGDRNIYVTGVNGNSYFNVASTIQVKPINPSFRWTEGLHGDAGNLLFNDGRVEQASSARLREAAEGGHDFLSGSTTMRFCIPR